MPRVLRRTSPERASRDGAPSPTRPKRNLKRSASQALLLTPPRTVKRDRRRRIGRRNVSGTSKSPSRSRSRGSEHGTDLEGSDKEEEEEVEIPLTSGIGRRLDFGPSVKKRRQSDLDARLETLLESFEGEDPENPFWDGPSKAKATDSAENEKGEAKQADEKSKDAEKIVRVRSPSPPLLKYRSKAPVSPPPSNRRRKKKHSVITVETIIESTAEEAIEKSEEVPNELPVEPTEESAGRETVGPSTVEPSAEEPPAKPAEEPSEQPAESPQAKSPEEPLGKSGDEPPVVEPPPLPRTPKKGKGRLDSPIRDSPDNPFLDDSPSSVPGEPAEPRTPAPRVEKPTISYTFRGVRVEFANPMYNVPPEVHERSLLPIEHPDYSPDPACTPKRLFTDRPIRAASPTRKARNKVETRSKPAANPAGSTGNEWDDSDDEAELHIPVPRRLFQ